MAKILIADDDDEIYQFCKYPLEQNHHTLLSAETGTKALQKLKEEKPDLLILDVMLPGMDGYSIELEVSKDPDLSRIPVIIVTALKPAEGLFKKFQQVVAFLEKPFSEEALLSAVNQALSKKL